MRERLQRRLRPPRGEAPEALELNEGNPANGSTVEKGSPNDQRHETRLAFYLREKAVRAWSGHRNAPGAVGTFGFRSQSLFESTRFQSISSTEVLCYASVLSFFVHFAGTAPVGSSKWGVSIFCVFALLLTECAAKSGAAPAVAARDRRSNQARAALHSRHGMYETARYGLCAVRIGQANHPGPPFQRRPAFLRGLHGNEHTRGLLGHPRPYTPTERSNATRRDEGVKDAAKMLTALAGRAALSSPSAESIPECIQRQRWSSLNVPLMWAAASGSVDTHALLEWLGRVTINAPRINTSDGRSETIADTVASGWRALRSRFRAWGISSEEDFVVWAHSKDFHSVRLRQHVHANCQEYILDRGVEEDVSVANLEIGYVATAMHLALMPQTLPEIIESLRRPASRCQQQLPSQHPQHSQSQQQQQQQHRHCQHANAPLDSNAQPSSGSWSMMTALDLEAEIRKPVRTVREPPRWFRGSLRQAFLLALRSREQRGEAAWKLFVLTPRMLLTPTSEQGEAGKAIFFERLRRFMRGDWGQLLAEAAASCQSRRHGIQELDEEEARRLRREEAEKRVRLREVSRARVLMTSSGLAPRNNETYRELTNNERRPRDLDPNLPQEALHHQPSTPVKLEGGKLAWSLRSAGRGSAPDLAGMRYEHLRVLLEDDDAWGFFTLLAQDFARAAVPDSVMQALRLGRMTALQREDGKIRGIVAGSVLRRLVCKAVAAQFSDEFLERTAPFQFALQTKAGTDALAHAIRLLTDFDPDAVVISLDGVGAFDHVKRSAFFSKLFACEELRPLLPLVSALYGSQSRFLWHDAQGEELIIEQGQGGEQGCPLMPALYALAQHDALAEASGNLLPSEHLFSFLDDLYVVTCRVRAAEAFKEVAGLVEEHAGVKSNFGKLRAWCRGGGPAPPDLTDISAEAWTADLPDELNGLVVLGTPLGKAAFVEAHARKRLSIEQRLLRELPAIHNPQVAWTLLLQSAVPRANHTLRVLPPTVSAAYAEAHDDAIWQTFCAIFGAEEHRDDIRAQIIASLPGRLGGLGLRSARRTAEAAFWASWMDALPVLASKTPALAAQAVTDLGRASGPRAACLQEVATARERLLELGAEELPTWQTAATGAEPPQPDNTDDFEFARGWQWYACSVRENFLAERVLKPLCDEPQRAMVLSQGGSGGAWLRAIPSEPVFQMNPIRFQVSMRRRLRWPLPLTTHECRGRACRGLHDDKGDHPASCPRSGLLKLRSRPIEKVWVRVLREGGARVRENLMLRDAGIQVDPADRRAIEIVVTGLPIEHGIPVAVDATMVSPLHADGTPHRQAAERPGVALQRGRRDKETTYPELLGSSQLRLLTAGAETGGRLSHEAVRLLSELAAHKAASEPQALRAAAARAWRARWITMVSFVCQDALAATLVDDGVALLDTPALVGPLSVDVWLDDAR